jgi:NitT/TauT family transport system permease protein
MFAGLRLSLGLALTGEVAAEFVAASNGIGAEIWRSWQIYRIDEMYANIVAISAVGVILSFVLLEVQRRLLSWDDGIELTK